MAAELILEYKKPGFPQYSDTERSFTTTIEYVGPLTELLEQRPAVNDVWGDYPGVCQRSDITPLEGSDHAELRVVTEYFYEASTTSGGTLREVNYEVEWVMFQRSLYEHPKFASTLGGTYALTLDDIVAIELWENETDKTLKAAYQYTSGGGTETLSANAKMFVRGYYELGQETWEDFAPVVRKTSTYVNGNPSESTAGEKEEPPNFSGKPDGYEWRKSADRAVKANGQTKWDRVEEWVGAEKIITDKNQIYWVPPA